MCFYFMRNKLSENLPWEEAEEGEEDDGKGRAALTFSYVSSEKLIQEAPFDSFPDIMFSLIHARTRQPAPEDTATVIYAIYLLVGSVLRAPHLLNGLYALPQFEQRLLDVLCCQSKDIRRQLASRLAHLCQHFENSQTKPAREMPMRFFLRLLLAKLPRQSIPDRPIEHYFQLLCDLLMAAPDRLIAEALQATTSTDIVTTPAVAAAAAAAAASGGGDDDDDGDGSSVSPSACDDLVLKVVRWIKARPLIEHSPYGAPDQVLAGLMRVLRTLLAKVATPATKESLGQGQTRMMSELLDVCLFADPGALTESGMHVDTSVNPAKCKTPLTRGAAYGLLAELCSGCSVNFTDVVNFFADRHLKAPPIKRWSDPGSLNKSTQYVGLRNLGATCYQNSVCQQVYMVPELREAILAAPLESGPKQPDKMLYHVQRMMAFLRESDAQYFDTEPFVKVQRVYGDPVNPRQQEDCVEFWQRLQEQLEERLKGLPQDKVFANLFNVDTLRWMVCQGHENPLPGSNESVLQVEFAPTIDEALDKTFNLSGDPVSDYMCKVCDEHVNGIIRAAIKRVPDHLVIMLRRFEWDYTGAIQRKKILDHFEISHRVNLGSYTKEGRDAKELRGQTINSPDMEFRARWHPRPLWSHHGLGPLL